MESGVPGIQETSGVMDFAVSVGAEHHAHRKVAVKTGHGKAVTPPQAWGQTEAWGQTGARGLQAAPNACSGLGPPGDLKVPPGGLVRRSPSESALPGELRLHQW